MLICSFCAKKNACRKWFLIITLRLFLYFSAGGYRLGYSKNVCRLGVSCCSRYCSEVFLRGRGLLNSSRPSLSSRRDLRGAGPELRRFPLHLYSGASGSSLVTSSTSGAGTFDGSRM